MAVGDSEPTRTLGNDEIHVQFRNRQDLVRQSIDYAKSRNGDPVSDDGQMTLPVQSFRTMVQALRMTYKTLGETIHQDLSGASAEPAAAMGYGARDPEGPSFRPEAADTVVMSRFNAIKPHARDALQEADRYSEFNENAVRHGDDITIPDAAFRRISDALIESNELMSDVLSDPKMLEELGSAAIPGHPPDHGDYGANWDPFHTGDWTRD